MRVLSLVVLSFAAAAQAFMPAAGPSATRTRGVMSMLKVRVWVWVDWKIAQCCC